VQELISNLRACLVAMSPLSAMATDAIKTAGRGGVSACTVGLMLNGCTVVDTMPGGPAFLSGELKGGDEIVEVDNKEVGLDEIVDAIKGSDQPGTKLRLRVKSTDRSLRTVELVRRPRAFVLERRDMLIALDELRAGATAHMIEQRGKRKPEEALIRFLGKAAEDATGVMDRLGTTEKASTDREQALLELFARVSAVTKQYLDRLEASLSDADPENPPAEGVAPEGGAPGGGQQRAGEARVFQLQERLSEAEARGQVAAQAHAATVLRMQAEVQTLQDQLAFARAQGGEVTATHADDVTLSAQLSKSKTLVAKLQAELAVAKQTMAGKNEAITAARVEAQARQDEARSDREALRALREAHARLEARCASLDRAATEARLAADKGAGGANAAAGADAASLQARVAALQVELDAERARAGAAERAAQQAQEEARILLRRRQADQSAMAQVELDVLAVVAAAAAAPDQNPSPDAGAGEAAPAGDAGAAGAAEGPAAEAGDAAEAPAAPAEPSAGAGEAGSAAGLAQQKYEAAIVKIGGLQQKVAELQGVVKSYQKQGKTGVLEMQSAARSATEAQERLEQERQRADKERGRLTGEFATERGALESKLKTNEAARAKLQDLLAKKEAQLVRNQEEAQKAAFRMKEEMTALQAPPPSRTKWTRHVHPPYSLDTSRPE